MKFCEVFSTVFIIGAVSVVIGLITMVVLTSQLGWKIVYEGKGGDWS